MVWDENKLAIVGFIFKTMRQACDQRKAGPDNDFAIMEAIGNLPLSNIKCPSLIMNGKADSDFPMSYAKYAHEAIPGFDLYKTSKKCYFPLINL